MKRFRFENLESRLALAGDTFPVVSVDSSDQIFIPFPIQNETADGVAVDLNGDGIKDWAFVAENPSTLSFHLVDESGSLNFISESPVEQANVVRHSDLNGDGFQDVLVGTSDLLVYMNRGVQDGNWLGMLDPMVTDVTDGIDLISDIQLADLNGDTVADIVIAHGSVVDAHNGRGNGAFNPPIRYPLESSVSGVAIGDIDGDSDNDLIVGNLVTKKLVQMSNEDGFFSATILPQTFEFGVRLVELADLNDNGLLDLIVGTSNQADDNIHLLPGLAEGGFGSPSVGYETIGAPVDFELGDFDADGVVDLVVGHNSTFHHPVQNNGPGGMSVLIGNDGAFLDAVRVATPKASRVEVVDTDNDGVAEVVGIVSGSTRLRRVRISADRPFSGERFDVDAFSSIVGDFNGDGRADAAGLVPQSFDDISNFSLVVWFGSETGLDDGMVAGTLPPSAFLYEGDFDGDGVSDIGSHHVAGADTTSTAVSFIFRDGDFVENSTVGSAISRPTAIDLGNGSDSLLYQTNSVTQLFVSEGDGTWEAGLRIENARTHLADINGDGSLDLVQLDNAATGVSVAFGTGNGQFNAASEPLPGEFGVSATGDVNGDGLQDLLLGGGAAREVIVLFGTTDPQTPLTNQVSLDLAVLPSRVVAADIDGDGDVQNELLVVSSQSVVVVRLEDGELSEVQSLFTGFQSASVLVDDANNDGFVDIIVAPPAGTSLSAFSIFFGGKKDSQIGFRR